MKIQGFESALLVGRVNPLLSERLFSLEARFFVSCCFKPPTFLDVQVQIEEVI